MTSTYVKLAYSDSDAGAIVLDDFNPAVLFSSTIQTGQVVASAVQADSATITNAILTSGTVTGSLLELGSASIASTQYVDDRIQTLIGTAPAALDTLQELVAAISSDGNFSTTISAQLADKVS